MFSWVSPKPYGLNMVGKSRRGQICNRVHFVTSMISTTASGCIFHASGQATGLGLRVAGLGFSGTVHNVYHAVCELAAYERQQQ